MALFKKNTEGKIKNLLNQSTSSVSIPEISNYKRKLNPTFISNGIFKTIKNGNISSKEIPRLQQSVNIESLRKTNQYAGSFRTKSCFVDQNNNDKSKRSLLLRYTSSSIFETNKKLSSKNNKRNITRNEGLFTNSTDFTDNNRISRSYTKIR